MTKNKQTNKQKNKNKNKNKNKTGYCECMFNVTSE